MAIPDSIRRHKPEDLGPCCIQRRGDRYYVFEATSKWDAVRKRPVKKTGKSLGKITEADGFIPNRYALGKRGNGTQPVQIVVKNYGAEELLMQLSPEISESLRKWFPSTFREIRTLALLRLTQGVGPKLARPAFLNSYLSDLCPDLPMSEEHVRGFVSALGLQLDAIDGFMRAGLLPGAQLVFDGSSFFAAFRDSLSETGYNPDHRTRKQVRIIYVFDRSTQRPQFYQVPQGSAADRSAFLDVIREAGIRDCIVIADKGFYTKQVAGQLMAEGIRYIFPLQSNTALVNKEVYDETRRREFFPSLFVYKNRSIYSRKTPIGRTGNFVYTFYDPMKASVENATLMQKTLDGWSNEGFIDFDLLDSSHKGYFSFLSNLNETSQEVYLSYKERQEIEQLYDYLKNIIEVGPSYAHSDESIRGWAFINHITALYFYGLIAAMRRAQLDRKHAPRDVIMYAEHIYAVKLNDGSYHVSSIRRKTQALLDALDVDMNLGTRATKS